MSEMSIGYNGVYDEDEFAGLRISDRVRDYMDMRFGAEEYERALERAGYDLLALIVEIKRERPGDFYRFFHDLLHEREIERFRREYNDMLRL